MRLKLEGQNRPLNRNLNILFRLLALAWLWFCLINHLRIEWSVNPQYAYGWAVPFLCGYLLWRNADKLKCGNAESPAVFSSSAFRLFSFFLLCLLYLPTRLIQEANPEWRLVSWALALEVIGLTLLLLQTTEYRPRTTFPIWFFLVAVPWPTILEAPLIQSLTRANIGVTIELLGATGIPAIQHGNVIEIGTGVVGVDDACSGVRSFQATLMISLFLGEFYALGVRRRALCVLAGFGLAFLFNVGRTLLLTRIASVKGVAAVAPWHDPAGVTILVACFVCLWLIAGALGKADSRKQKVETGTMGRQDPGTIGAEAGNQSVGQSCAPGWASAAAGAGPSAQTAQGSRGGSPSCLAWSLAAWILFVETGTELWYRAHEWRVPQTPTWRVELPRNNPTFRELPPSAEAQRILRYDERLSGAWQEGADRIWQAVFLRWNPGRIAVHLARSHTPEVCLRAIGREVVSQPGLQAVPVHGLQLPFRSYVIKNENGPLHVFYCLWDDRATAQTFQSASLTYASRLAPVLAGRRNPGQRSLEVAITGYQSVEDARAALAPELEKLIRVEPNQ